jgi:hypothetical protein
MSLNCESTLVKVMDRGGHTNVFDVVPYLTLTYTRVRDDISTCVLSVSTDDKDCCANLAKLEAGRHEIKIIRNGVGVWEGPITRIEYGQTVVTIEAKDCWHYVYRTILHEAYNNAFPHTDFATERIRTMMTAELSRGWEAVDPAVNILPFLDIRTTEDSSQTTRNTLPFEKTMWEEIDDMAARSGVDYTSVGRALLVYDTDYLLGRTVPLTDADFDGEVIATQYGMNLCTFSAVTDGLGNWSATRVDEDYYGPWEMLETSYSLQDTIQCAAEGASDTALAEMSAQTVRNLSNRYPTPVVVRVPDNSRLNPDTGLTINDLVPGTRIPLRATETCRKVTQEQKLDRVTFTMEGGLESITVVMSPAPGSLSIIDGGTGGPPPVDPGDPGGPPGSGGVHPSAPGLVAPLLGLVDRNGIPSVPYRGAVKNIVISVDLADLYPTEGDPLDFSSIDDQIADGIAAGMQGARLRIYAGREAPLWIKNHSTVGHYTVTSPTNDDPDFECPRFWTQGYRDIVTYVDAQLAARYDDNPFIHEINVWAVGTQYSAEAGIRQMADAGNRTRLIAAGYTTPVDVAHCKAFADSVSDHWRSTRVIFWAALPWQNLNVTTGRWSGDINIMRDYAQYCVRVTSGRGVYGINNADAVSYERDRMYALRRTIAGSFTRGDQTATMSRVGGPALLLETISDATADHVRSLELPSGYSAVGVTALTAADALMRTTAGPLPPQPGPIGTGLKDPMLGLAWMGGGLPPQRLLDAGARNTVLWVDWAELSNSLDGTILTGNPLDNLINRARASGYPLKIKVRIQPTPAPSAVTTLGGPTMDIEAFGAIAHPPRWWRNDAQTAWAAFMVKFAQRYDAVPEVGEVAISFTGIRFGEPMVRPLSAMQGTTGNDSLWIEGLRSGIGSNDQLAHMAAIDAMQAFDTTRVSMTFSPYHVWSTSTGDVSDLTSVVSFEYVQSIIDYGRATLGAQLVIGNLELGRDDWYTGNQLRINNYMQAQGEPIFFQQANDDHVPGRTASDFLQQWQDGADKGACLIEIYGSVLNPTLPGGGGPPGISQLRDADLMLRRNWT